MGRENSDFTVRNPGRHHLNQEIKVNITSSAASLPLCVRDQGHGTVKPKQWAESEGPGERPDSRRACQLSGCQAQATRRAALQTGSLPDEAEEAQKTGRGVRSYWHCWGQIGCPGKPQRVTGPKFPGPEVSVVTRDSGYVQWLHGTQGRSFPGQPTPLWANSDAWEVHPEVELKSSSLQFPLIISLLREWSNHPAICWPSTPGKQNPGSLTLLSWLFISPSLKDTASVLQSHRATFRYFASPGAVLIVLPFFSIFCPDSFSVCDELEGNCHGVDLNRMKGVLLLGQSHGRREGPCQDGVCEAACSLLLPGPLAAVASTLLALGSCLESRFQAGS